jgi:hypothetical protein
MLEMNTALAEELGRQARWDAWVRKGQAHDRALRRTVTTTLLAATSLGLVLLVVLAALR